MPRHVRSISRELRPVALRRSISSGLADTVELTRRTGQPGVMRQLSDGMFCPKAE